MNKDSNQQLTKPVVSTQEMSDTLRAHYAAMMAVSVSLSAAPNRAERRKKRG